MECMFACWVAVASRVYIRGYFLDIPSSCSSLVKQNFINCIYACLSLMHMLSVSLLLLSCKLAPLSDGLQV